MDKEEGKRDWAAIVQAMPAVQKLIAEKRAKYGAAHVNECWKRGVLAGEPGWFYARERGVAVGTPWGDPLYFEALEVTRTQALLMMAEPKKCADCGAQLTPNEVHYYGATCEKCEARGMADGAH